MERQRGQTPEEKVVVTYTDESTDTELTTAVSILAANEMYDADWLVEVQDINGTRQLGRFLSVAELDETDSIEEACERVVKYANKYGPSVSTD